jgi:hypothetical protein
MAFPLRGIWRSGSLVPPNLRYSKKVRHYMGPAAFHSSTAQHITMLKVAYVAPSIISYKEHFSNPSSRKPKNARAKRAMEKRAPQQHENPKVTLFLAGGKTSNILKLAMSDLATLKRPFVERFTKKNDIHPFDDASCTVDPTL